MPLAKSTFGVRPAIKLQDQKKVKVCDVFRTIYVFSEIFLHISDVTAVRRG
jgi:hypothetical protein